MAGAGCGGGTFGAGQCVLHAVDAAPCPRGSGKGDAEGGRAEEVAGTIYCSRSGGIGKGLRSGGGRQYPGGSVSRYPVGAGGGLEAGGQTLIEGPVSAAGAFPRLAAGWKPVVKLSSKDRYLLPVLFPGVEFCDSTDGWTPDAMLTMGGDAAAAYFETHFPYIPKIIRSSRFSMAVLTGSEDSSALKALAEDMLLYYGLGCRSATCLLVPQGYDLSGAVAAAEAFALRHWERPGRDNHRKNKAVLTLSGEEFLDSGTVIFRDLRRLIPGASEDISLCRVGEVWYVEYRSEMELEKFIGANEDRIQKIIRNFGYAQRPALDDWPDGVDTVGFLRGVNK